MHPLMGRVKKRGMECEGGWRQNGQKAACVKRGDPGGGEIYLEVRTCVVAKKRL